MKKFNINLKNTMSVIAFIVAIILAFYNPSAQTIIGMFLGSAMGVVSFKDLLKKNE